MPGKSLLEKHKEKTEFVNTFLLDSEGKAIVKNGAILQSDWMQNEETKANSMFVNLLENSEAYTMYNGSHIWKAIYEENCFGEDACTE